MTGCKHNINYKKCAQCNGKEAISKGWGIYEIKPNENSVCVGWYDNNQKELAEKNMEYLKNKSNDKIVLSKYATLI